MSNSPAAHNIQAGGHQILRVSSSVSTNLIKPVGRDAVVAMHLIQAKSDNGNTLPSLSFLLPFVPNTHRARAADVVVGKDGGNNLTADEIDAFKILTRWRNSTEGALKQFPNGTATFQEYFAACRDVLKATEKALEPHKKAKDGSDDTGDDTPAEGKDDSSKAATVADTKKPRLTSAKPWELVMDNLTAGMVNPQVLDLKLGRMKTQPGADRAEEKEAKDAGTTAKSCGVRIAGLSVTCGASDKNSDADITIDVDADRKPFSDTLPAGWERKLVTSKDKLRDVVKVYLSNIVITAEGDEARADAAKEIFLGEVGDSKTSVKATFIRPLALKMLSDLKPIVEAFHKNRQWFNDNLSILSSSVLFIYDAADWDSFGTSAVGATEDAALASMREVVVRLIDFDRTGPRAEHYSEDEIRYVSALETILELFEELTKV